MSDEGDGAIDAPANGHEGNTAGADAARTASANAGKGGGNDGNQGGDGGRGGRRKPDFSEEQNRYIGGLVARHDDKLRTVETERDAEREKAKTLSDRVATLERDNRQARAENAVIAAAAKLKADNPEHVYRMVRDELQFDDQGKPKDVTTLLEGFKKDNPRYFGGVTVSGADGGKGSGASEEPTDMSAFLRRGAQAARARLREMPS